MTLSSLVPTPPSALAGRAVWPADHGYRSLRSTYTHVKSPAVVLRPRDDDEVAAAIRYAAASSAVVSVRSGGHGLSGQSSNDGGIVIDLGDMRDIEVIDRDAGIVRVQAGARWGQVADRLAREGLAISSGDHGNVGVGGLATAGGVGWLTRSFGLTIDRVQAATVVLVDGTIVRADPANEPELFWAVRGAGDAVGIVTEFEIRADRLGLIGIGQVILEVDRDGRGLQQWSEALADAPRDLTTNGILGGGGDQFVLQLTTVVASDDEQVIRERIAPLLEIGTRSLGAQVSIAPYTALVNTGQLHANHGQQPSNTTNALLPRLDAQRARLLMDVVAHPAAPLVQLRSLGGATHDLAADATAWAHRDSEVLAVLSTFPPDRGSHLDAAFAPLLALRPGSYRNFESRPDDATFGRAFPGATGERVLALRDRFDPDGVLQRLKRSEEGGDLAA